MKVWHTLLILSALVALAAAQEVAPIHVVDLDAPAAERWVDITSQYKEKYAPVLAWMDKLIPQDLQKILDPILASLDTLLPGEYGQELKGAAKGSGIELGTLVAMNLIYDFSAFCTSIVAQNDDGTIYHSRNLDYPIEGLRNITAEIHYKKGGAIVYKCTTFVGYLGCLTGLHYGVGGEGSWSLSVDERDAKNSSVWDNVQSALHGGKSLGFFLRDTLEKVNGFDQAKQTFIDAKFIAPVYIIMAGDQSGQGAIITRDRNTTRDVWNLADAGQFWILETNYDHWEPVPARDNRRGPANQAMQAVGSKSVNSGFMYEVLSIVPVLNAGTKYTTSIIPKTLTYNTTIRWDAPTHVSYGFKRSYAGETPTLPVVVA